MRAEGRRLERLVTEARAVGRDQDWRRRRRQVKLVAVNQDAAGQPDDDDVDADRHSSPQVHLEQRTPQPYRLGLPQPAAPEDVAGTDYSAVGSRLSRVI